MIDNKKLIIISLLFILCLASFYGVVEYYSNKEIEYITIKDKEISDNVFILDTSSIGKEINLGEELDDDGCEERDYVCNEGTLYAGKCWTQCSPMNVRTCDFEGGKRLRNGDCCFESKAPIKGKECTKCKTGYNLKDGACSIACSVDTSIIQPSAKRISIGGNYDINGTVILTKESSDNCSATISTVNDKSIGEKTFKPKANSKFIEIRYTVEPQTSCDVSEYSVIVGGKTIASGTVEVTGTWSENSIPLPGGCRERIGDEAISQPNAENARKDYYLTDKTQEVDEKGKKTYFYCSKIDRGECCSCSPPPGGNPACYKNALGEYRWTTDSRFGTKTGLSKNECKNCYGDARLFSLATKVKGLAQPDTAHPIFIAGVSYDKCVKDKPTACVPQATGDPKEEKEINANVCEDTINEKTKDGMDCDGTPYYTINCTNNTSTKFDLGDDGGIITSTNNMLVGQGFKYGITVKVTRTCKGNFNGEIWKKAYDYAESVITHAKNDQKKSPTAKEATELEKLIKKNQNKLNDLKDMVTAYNNYNLNKVSSVSSTIEVNNYKVKGKSKTISTKLVSTVIQKGSGKYSEKKKVNLKIDGITNPYNYEWNNKDEPTIIKLVPPKQYINNNGEIANSGLDAGNKIYVDYYTNPKTYSLSINAKGIGGKISISNTKCSIKVKEQELLYRPIDLSNPFINDKWKPGINWVNDLFDFRNVIKADIWGN